VEGSSNKAKGPTFAKLSRATENNGRKEEYMKNIQDSFFEVIMTSTTWVWVKEDTRGFSNGGDKGVLSILS